MIRMSTQSIVSFSEFERLPDSPEKIELLDGELIVSPPPEFEHSVLAQNCEAQLLRHWPRSQVWVEVGFKCAGAFLQPDVSVIHADQPRDGRYLAGAPAIAAEVRSASNTKAEMERKVEVYLLNGIRRATEVWVIEQKRRSVTVYTLENGKITLVRHNGPFTCSYGGPLINPAEFFAH